ncbi:MAG: hypothetical protein HN780_03120 [Gemmatimonadetes bacterium]|nr:hypothetical protein [Gemmatimonadota bacterium]
MSRCIEYRTLVFGLIATAAFLTLSIVSGWSDFAAWGLVAVAFVIIAIAYAIVILHTQAMRMFAARSEEEQ